MKSKTCSRCGSHPASVGAVCLKCYVYRHTRNIVLDFKRTLRRKQNHECVSCGKPLKDFTHPTCTYCRKERMNNYYKAKMEGRCTGCQGQIDELAKLGRYKLCSVCLERRRVK